MFLKKENSFKNEFLRAQRTDATWNYKLIGLVFVNSVENNDC